MNKAERQRLRACFWTARRTRENRSRQKINLSLIDDRNNSTPNWIVGSIENSCVGVTISPPIPLWNLAVVMGTPLARSLSSVLRT